MSPLTERHPEIPVPRMCHSELFSSCTKNKCEQGWAFVVPLLSENLETEFIHRRVGGSSVTLQKSCVCVWYVMAISFLLPESQLLKLAVPRETIKREK